MKFGTDHSKVYFTDWPNGPVVRNNDKTVDLSWWKNFDQNSRSIFAWGSRMGFVGGYDYGKDAGTVDCRQPFPGPRQEILPLGEQPGRNAVEQDSADKDGHYLELMVGGYSDNQPDYSWLAPGEIREFNSMASC